MRASSLVRKKRTKLPGRVVIAATIVLTAAAIALAAAGVGPQLTEVKGKDSVTIPGTSLQKGGIRFFSYRDEVGKEIRFILGRDDTGQVHGAFDACQQCAQYHKGYSSSRGYLVCRFCGNRYRLNSTAQLGSCAPIKLPVQESGSAVSIDTARLKQHRGLF
jgi:uncharacterized membrane protein